MTVSLLNAPDELIRIGRSPLLISAEASTFLPFNRWSLLIDDLLDEANAFTFSFVQNAVDQAPLRAYVGERVRYRSSAKTLITALNEQAQAAVDLSPLERIEWIRAAAIVAAGLRTFCTAGLLRALWSGGTALLVEIRHWSGGMSDLCRRFLSKDSGAQNSISTNPSDVFVLRSAAFRSSRR